MTTLNTLHSTEQREAAATSTDSSSEESSSTKAQSGRFQRFDSIPLLTKTHLKEQEAAFQQILARQDEATKGVLEHYQFKQIESGDEDSDTIEEKVRLMGMLTYALEQHPDSIPDVNQIEKLFARHCSAVFDRIESIKQLHEQLKMQSSFSAVSIELPRLIARDILTRSGHLNIGIMLRWVQDKRIPATNFGTTLKERLGTFLDHTEARSTLSAIKVDSNRNAPIHRAIRATLALSPDTDLTDYHGQLAALTAALTHIRQSPSYTCFSLVICLSQLSLDLKAALDDLKELIGTSKLMRQIGPKPHEFRFLPVMISKKLKESFKLAPNGEVNASGRLIWESPGIKAACTAMNIGDTEAALKKLLPKSVEEKNCRKIIMQLAKQADTKDWEDRFHEGCFAFESQTSNALLSMWSNTVASMAEGKLSGMLKSMLIHATMMALKVEYKGLKEEQAHLPTLIEERILERIIRYSYYHYEPYLGRFRHTSRKNLPEEGFVLYNKHPNEWLRIDKADLFQNFITDIITETTQDLPVELEQKEDQLLYAKIGRNLARYVQTGAFLDRLLAHYTEGQYTFKNPSEHIHELEYTPWLTRGGNDTEQTALVYYGDDRTLHTHRFQAQTAEELLTRLAQFGQVVQKSNPQLFAPSALVTVRVEGLHAFSLILGHRSFKEFLSAEDKIQTIIEKRLIVPGKKAASTKLENRSVGLICTKIGEKLIEKRQMRPWRKAVETLLTRPTVAELRSELKKITEKFGKKDDPEQLLRQLDTLILNNLPEKIQKEITDNTVHIADTNWNCGLQDLHFCILFNPGTEQIELWRCCDTNYDFVALSQKEWVEGDWELFYP